MLGNQLSYLETPLFNAKKVQAQAEKQTFDPKPTGEEKISLIAILVEKELMDNSNLDKRITTYAQNAQSRIPHSKALILEIEEDESPFRIATTLEKLYQEGMDPNLLYRNLLPKKGETNKLAGIVLIGDVPIPVVHEEGGSYPSLYPYTDFYRKGFIYNHASKKYERNDAVPEPNPEIWHGVIVPPAQEETEKVRQLMDFFKKNDDFSNKENDMATFHKRVLYANYPAMESQANFMDYKNYLRFIKWMEEMVFERFNKNLLKEVIKEVSTDMGNPDEPIISDEAIDFIPDALTGERIRQYAMPLVQALRIYRSGINEAIQQTGRWSTSEVDTPESLISFRDVFAKNELKKRQLILEHRVNETVRQTLSAEALNVPVVQSATLEVELEIAGADAGSDRFTFFSYIDGQRIGLINSVSECGIEVGQRPAPGAKVIEDNSIAVRANRMYNPDTLLVPPEDADDWKLTEQRDYKTYAGCVANNSIEIEETGATPDKCIPEDAIQSIFDIAGSIHIPEDETFRNMSNRCDVDRMTFRLNNEDQFNDDITPSIVSATPFQTELKNVIDRSFDQLNDKPGLPKNTRRHRASALIKRLSETGSKISYKPIPGVKITVSAEGRTKNVPFFHTHVEPTNETLQAIMGDYPSITTPALPADGVRSVSFGRNGLLKNFEYLNLFRIPGENEDQIFQSFLQSIRNKEAELGKKLGTETNVHNQFYSQNTDALEPITWRALSIDQKLSEILEKYVNRDSFMPPPPRQRNAAGNLKPKEYPQHKPDGYEVMHIVANGDETGFEFGLNRAMLNQAPDIEADEDETDVLAAEDDTTDEEAASRADEGSNEEKAVNLCGDPNGVEIWEWFDSLQCWIQEEILPAEELLSLSYACSAMEKPAETEEEEEDLLNRLEVSPTALDVQMQRQTLIPGQEETIEIRALDINGEPIFGYISDKVQLNLSDPELGTFSKNSFNLYAGTEEVTFTPKKLGRATLTVSMGEELPEETLEISVVESIRLDWSSTETLQNGRSRFDINIGLLDPGGQTIRNISGPLRLAAKKPADGNFANGGVVSMNNGQAEAAFRPAPGKKSIDLISQDPYIKGPAHTIQPTELEASELRIKAPRYLPIGRVSTVKIQAVDPYGYPARSFSESIEVTLDRKSESFARLENDQIQLVNGEAKVSLQAFKESADISLTASHKDLEEATITLPLLERVDSSTWKETYPQSLFASFVGFPAGNVTVKDYFGGVHLFSGKTQAVFSFLSTPAKSPIVTIQPNHQIELSGQNQLILTAFHKDSMQLEVIEQETGQTQLSKSTTLKFSNLSPYVGQDPEAGNLYYELLDDSFQLREVAGGVEIQTQRSQPIARLNTGQIRLIDNSYRFEYNLQPEKEWVELALTDGQSLPLRIMLNLEPESMNPEKFDEIIPTLQTAKTWEGLSNQDATGLMLYDPEAETQEETRNEFYGITGKNDYITQFANGIHIGEATKHQLPTAGILLGDPTIRLETDGTASLEEYNSAAGERIFTDPANTQIASINYFDHNNDGREDIAVLLEDGRIRLLEGGDTEPPYRDRGDMAYLHDGGVAVERFDFKQDGYEDLVVATREGRLGILHNDGEVITREDHQLNIGKELYQLRKDDMDQDGYGDLVILDSRGDILIFYYNPNTKSFPQNGRLIDNYGFSINKEGNLIKDLSIRYPGIPEPESLTESGNVTTGSSADLGGEVDEDTRTAFIEKQRSAASAAREDPAANISAGEIPKLPWPEGDETESYFEPIENPDFLTVKKQVSNKERPNARNVDLEEVLTYTISITSGRNLNDVVIADIVPDALTFDPQSVTCLRGECRNIKSDMAGTNLFLSNINLSAGQETIITYEATVSHTPQAAILLQRLTEPPKINDPYIDILVSPPYNNTGLLHQHYSVGPREYRVMAEEEAESPNQEGSEYARMMEALENEDFSSLENDLMEAAKPDSCYESWDSRVSCTEGALDDLAEAISNFSCAGGGCFPMPWNYAFMVPPQSPTPIFAFPATLPTPVGPLPSPASVFFPLPGMAAIPGPILSMIRFYISPTLTGGMGMAMCWGPYPVSPTVPPPVFPIPYPPPIGNCMVTALPRDALPYKGLCQKIEKGINKVMSFINSGVDKIDSTVQAINNNPNLPLNVSREGNGGAGGLEVELSVNLGQSMKFEPPAKAFSNIHLPNFDSVGGVLSDWLDRQMLDIRKKLFKLPTFTVYLPDFKTLWTLDAERTGKAFDGWINRMSGIGRASKEARQEIKNQDRSKYDGVFSAPDGEGSLADAFDGGQWRGSLENLKGGKGLAVMGAIEDQANVYKTGSLEDLYDIASTLPLLNIREKPIAFDIPWLSAAEIQAYILELEEWVLYYEREYARVKDKWERITCKDFTNREDFNAAVQEYCSRSDNKACATEEGLENVRNTVRTQMAAQCIGRQAADAFAADFDPLINSAKENIEVLQSYLNYPKKLVKLKEELADYIRGVGCYLEIWGKVMGGWTANLREDVISWAELILTIVEIVNNIEKLFDVFTKFDTNCSICTNERFSNFGWWSLLGLVLPDIPIIEFPKWPDIVVDLSNLDAAIDIELPMLRIRPKRIPLPELPYITLPDFPNLNILVQIPPLPVLPRLPDLPEWPPLPPIPTIDLPTLPPPPKLPDVGKSFEAIIPLIEKILQLWCIIKKSMAPIPEMMLNEHISLLTNRPAYLTPLDLLDVQAPNIALFDLGFNELRIETVVYLGLRLDIILKPLENAAETWNGWIDEIPKFMNEKVNEKILEAEAKAQEALDKVEEKMQEAADTVETGVEDFFDETLGLGDLADTSEKAEEELRRIEEELEREWTEWAEESNLLNPSYDAWKQRVETWNETASQWGTEARDDVRKFMNSLEYGYDVLALTPMVDASLQLVEGTDEGVEELLKVLSDGINKSLTIGPVELEKAYSCIRFWGECNKNTERYLEQYDQNVSSDDFSMKYKAPYGNLMPDPDADRINEQNQAESIKQLVGQINSIVQDINNAPLVDYRKVKRDLGVPDFVLPPNTAMEDKMNGMRDKLFAQSDQLMQEASSQKGVRDLTVIAGVPPVAHSEFSLATAESINAGNEERIIFTNAVTPSNNSLPDKTEGVFRKLEAAVSREAKALPDQDRGVSVNGACDAALCYPDENLNPIPIVPHLEQPATSETLFLPSGNIVYNDGSSLYLKRDLSQTETPESDTALPRRHTLNTKFLAQINQFPLRESVNMLESTLTESGAATFSWEESGNPEVHGYGIEMERSILGYDQSHRNSELPDVKIILLPPAENGNAPEVLVNDELIPFGTLVSGLDSEEAMENVFGIQAANQVTGADMVVFPTLNNASITVSDTKAVLFDRYSGGSYSLGMPNGYHHIKITWFDQNARTASYNHNELLAPQKYVDAADPIDITRGEIPTVYMPVFKEKTIQASDYLIDISGNYQHYWTINPESNITPEIGSSLTLPAQDEPKTYNISLVSTPDIQDNAFEKHEKRLKVVVYVPEIELDEAALKEGRIEGSLLPNPESPNDDLDSIPFSVFRKRFDTWKNVGLLIKNNPAKSPTSPPLGAEESYYTESIAGEYRIENFDLSDPSPVILKDHNGALAARIDPVTGTIELLGNKFEMEALPASRELPTRIALIEKETGLVGGNVYYMADSNTDIEIRNGSLNYSNVSDLGVTVGDANSSDDIIAANIPGFGPSFPGGVAIFNQSPPQTNVALIDTDGTIRMMQAGYRLRIKNPSETSNPYIFQIINSQGAPVYDVYIQPDQNNLVVEPDEMMDSREIQIGLRQSLSRTHASLMAQNAPSPSDPPADQPSDSPFSDLDEAHPYYQQILDLYEKRVIQGYGDGEFKPDQKITRAEFVKIALGVSNCFDCSNPTDEQIARYLAAPFPDVNLPSWYFYCISIAKELGMVTGYGDGLFRPERNISRAEAAAVLLRQSGIDFLDPPPNYFQDVPDYAWYVDEVYTAVQIGLIPETAGFVFPDEEITRGEFAFMAAGVSDIKECRVVDTDFDGIPDWWEAQNGLDPLAANAAEAFSGYCPCEDNPNQSDTDGDGIKDVCDIDIDNDGVINPICIFDEDGNLDEEKIKEGAQDVEEDFGYAGIDNCIFVENADQADQDRDGVGNECEVECPCRDNPNTNDSDNDGIRDVCDDDIDNDGVGNPICIFDKSGLVDQGTIDDLIESGQPVDNCLFDPNAAQADGDNDNTGDACEEDDLCPQIPEDHDGVDDEDGCPEVDDGFPVKDPGIYVNQGPACSFLDYEADMVKDDIFMTAITDLETHEVLYSSSNEAGY
jgi:uncharacterized repeat protein (TIGR01451 family)